MIPVWLFSYLYDVLSAVILLSRLVGRELIVEAIGSRCGFVVGVVGGL